MPIYTYNCEGCSAQTDILRPYALRREEGECKDCAGVARYIGLCSPSIQVEKQTAVHLADGSRVVGTFGPPPARSRSRTVSKGGK